MKYIDFTERNIHGAVVVWGQIGIRQYYGYTKKAAVQKYREECEKTLIVNQPPKKH